MKPKQKITLYFVDDDPIYLRTLENTLKESTYYEGTVKTFATGEDCLKTISSSKPDIVVLDYYLNSVNPDAINGIETLKKIKKASPRTHVIMLSGQDRIDVAINSMRYGAFDYVIKNENAFIRAQNNINNINENIRLRKVAEQTRRLAIIVIGLLVTIATSAFVFNKINPGML